MNLDNGILLLEVKLRQNQTFIPIVNSIQRKRNKLSFNYANQTHMLLIGSREWNDDSLNREMLLSFVLMLWKMKRIQVLPEGGAFLFCVGEFGGDRRDFIIL